MNCQSLNCCTYLQIILHNIIREYVLSLTFSMSNGVRVSTVHYLHSRGKTTTLSRPCPWGSSVAPAGSSVSPAGSSVALAGSSVVPAGNSVAGWRGYGFTSGTCLDYLL